MNERNLWWTRGSAIMLVVTCLYTASSWTAGDDAGMAPTPNPAKNRGRRIKPPGTYTIRMPDFHEAPEQERRDSVNALYYQLDEIANEVLLRVTDPTLPIDQRTEALMIAQKFDAQITAPRLVTVIDFKDDRGFTSGHYCLGDFPIVEALTKYGTSAVSCVLYSLAAEKDIKRRELLYDVLEQGAGLEYAKEKLVKLLGEHKGIDNKVTEREENLTLVLEEIRSR